MRLTNCLRCDEPVVGRGLQRLCAECNKDWKWCPRCESLKSLEEFRLPNGRPIGFCLDCWNSYARERRKGTEGKDESYRLHLKKKFGITRERAAQLAAVEGCEICGDRPAPGDRLHVDHEHSTGEIRGVLCRWCNYAVAVLEDDRLTQIQAYLREAAKRRLTVVR